MKYVPSSIDSPTIELTRRNLTTLLAKLGDPHSRKTLWNDGFYVRAVEDEEHYGDRPPGEIRMPSEDAIAEQLEFVKFERSITDDKNLWHQLSGEARGLQFALDILRGIDPDEEEFR